MQETFDDIDSGWWNVILHVQRCECESIFDYWMTVSSAIIDETGRGQGNKGGISGMNVFQALMLSSSSMVRECLTWLHGASIQHSAVCIHDPLLTVTTVLVVQMVVALHFRMFKLVIGRRRPNVERG